MNLLFLSSLLMNALLSHQKLLANHEFRDKSVNYYQAGNIKTLNRGWILMSNRQQLALPLPSRVDLPRAKDLLLSKVGNGLKLKL